MGDRLETLLELIANAFRSGVGKLTVSPVVTTASKLLVAANHDRMGLILYNNSANSVYVSFTGPANSSTNMAILIPTFTQFVMQVPVFTGDVYGIRNAGTGTVLCTELLR